MNKNIKMLVLAGLSGVAAFAADYATPAAAVTALEGAAASTTSNYLGWVTLGVGAILIGTAVWAVRKGISLRK